MAPGGLFAGYASGFEQALQQQHVGDIEVDLAALVRDRHGHRDAVAEAKG
jgi:hypothetical protein